MLAKRIIPTLLCRGRQLVKGKQFKSWRSVGLAMQAARIHSARQVDELMILDIAATKQRRGPDLELVKELSETCFIPITVGGGIRSVDDVNNLLKAGADKVAICSAAYANQFGLIKECANRFGSQAIVGVVEYRDDIHRIRVTTTRCGTLELMGWPEDMAHYMAEAGAGEIMLNSISRDGMMGGLDTKLIGYVARRVNVPVIASGGCGSYEHILEAFQAGADAVATGAMLQFTDNTPRGAAEFLQSKGVEVRLENQ